MNGLMRLDGRQVRRQPLPGYKVMNREWFNATLFWALYWALERVRPRGWRPIGIQQAQQLELGLQLEE